jgi:hypothetical protein
MSLSLRRSAKRRRRIRLWLHSWGTQNHYRNSLISGLKNVLLCFNIFRCYHWIRGPSSVVGLATGYGLDGPGIESQLGARFFTPVQTGPGARRASCTMDTGSFPGLKNGRGVTLTSHHLVVPWSWKSTAVHLHLLWAVQLVLSLSACTKVYFTFTFYHTLCTLHLS